MDDKLKPIQSMIDAGQLDYAYDLILNEGLDKASNPKISQKVYGWLYQILSNAESVHYNLNKSVQILSKNADTGCVFSVKELGKCKLFGRGIEKNIAGAEDLFRRSESLPESRFYIAEIQANGLIHSDGEPFFDFVEAKKQYLSVYEDESAGEFRESAGLSFVNAVERCEESSDSDHLNVMKILQELVSAGSEDAMVVYARRSLSGFFSVMETLMMKSKKGKYRANRMMKKQLDDLRTQEREWSRNLM